MKVALYTRVSTVEQTCENQYRELMAVAQERGWDVVCHWSDAGISGAKGRDSRPAFDRVWDMVTAREVDMVAAWSVDRLGRSMKDLINFLDALNRHGVNLYLHQQKLDTTTPMGRAMFGMYGIFAEFERSMIQERVKSGLARAAAEGRKGGRPEKYNDQAADIARLVKSTNIYQVSKGMGISRNAVARIVEQVKSGAIQQAR